MTEVSNATTDRAECGPKVLALMALLRRNAFLASTALILASATAPAYSQTLEKDFVQIDQRQMRLLGIETVAVEPQPPEAEYSFPATVVIPPDQLRVASAPIAGMVEAVLVAVDDNVLRDQPLAIVRSPELVEAQRSFLEAASNEELRRQSLGRDEALFREQIIPERRVQTARAEHNQALSALNERRQVLRLLGMGDPEVETLRRSQALSSAMTVRAPMAGSIIEQSVVVGQRVSAATPLFKLAQLQPMWINIQVPAGRAPSLDLDTPVLIPTHAARGKVVRIGRTVDPANQTIQARAEITEGAQRLRQGQFVEAVVQLRTAEGRHWRVPASSVVHFRQGHVVFVSEQGGFRARPVKVIAESPKYAVVSGALDAGQNVVHRGLLALKAELANIGGDE